MSTAAWVVVALVGLCMVVIAGLLLAEGVLRLGARWLRRCWRRQLEETYLAHFRVPVDREERR